MALTEANLRALQPNDVQRGHQLSLSQFAASSITWYSGDSDFDPIVRDPGQRPEGRAVLHGDELLFRGVDEPVVKDGTPPPEDVEFWKAKDRHFTAQYHRITAKKDQGTMPASNLFGPYVMDRTQAWIPAPPEAAAYCQSQDRDGAFTLDAQTPSQAADQVERPEQQPAPTGERPRKRSRHDTPEANTPPSKMLKPDYSPSGGESAEEQSTGE
ncbi:hypothetical protein QQZ08_003736 [Neonectria magnoliae]|uniref:Uncharacterized protein n=1 Tax=Neonectria magnoliae TaxID=2732573 RepID=A0ABR1I9N0_9HYPO